MSLDHGSTLRLLAHPANPAHVQMLEEIIRCFEHKDVRTISKAFHLDDWYHLSVVPKLQSSSVPFIGFPGIDAENRPIWKLNDATAVIAAAYAQFESTFQDTVEKFRPDVFLLFGDQGVFEVGMLQSCRKQRCPSVLVQEGYIPHRHGQQSTYYSQFSRRVTTTLAGFLKGSTHGLGRAPTRGIPPVHPLGLNKADMVATINDQDAAWLVANGLDPDRVIVTGHVLMDRLWRFVREQPALQSGTYSSPREERPLSLLVVSPGQAHFNRKNLHDWFVKNIRRLAQDDLRGQLTVHLRLKPGESLNDWTQSWGNLQKFARIVSNSDDLYPQILEVDAVLGMNSQALVEALMLEKPVINLVRPNAPDPFQLNGLSCRATDSRQVANMLRDLPSLEWIEKQAAYRNTCYPKHFYHFDGQAAARTCQVIERALELHSKTEFGKPFRPMSKSS